MQFIGVVCGRCEQARWFTKPLTDSVGCGVFLQQRCFATSVFSANFPYPSPPCGSFFTDIFSFCVGFMAGLRRRTSYGCVILSRGCLPKVKDPGYSKHPAPIHRCSCFKIVETLKETTTIYSAHSLNSKKTVPHPSLTNRNSPKS